MVTKESENLITKQKILDNNFRRSGDQYDQQMFTKVGKETKPTVKPTKKTTLILHLQTKADQ